MTNRKNGYRIIDKIRDTEVREMEGKMEIRKISNNWYGIYDKVKRKFVIESTKYGIEVYRKMFNL